MVRRPWEALARRLTRTRREGSGAPQTDGLNALPWARGAKNCLVVGKREDTVSQKGRMLKRLILRSMLRREHRELAGLGSQCE